MEKRIPGKQKGYALLVVILSMFMVTTLGAAMFTRVYTDLKSREGQEERIRLSYAAQAGIEESLFRIHEAIASGRAYPASVTSDPSALGLEDASINSTISRTGDTYSINCTAQDLTGGKSFRIIAEAIFREDAASRVTDFEVLSYERSFNGN